MNMSNGMTAKGSGRAVRPPRLAQLFLRISLPSGLRREAILGDFWEDYRHRWRSQSPWRARVWYWRELGSVSARSWGSRLNVVARRRRGAASGGSPSSGSNGMPPIGQGGKTSMMRLIGNTITEDIPYGVRNLIRTPGFTAIAVLSLALGMVPMTAIGSFLNASFFRPLPVVEDQEQLVAIFRGVSGPVSWLDIEDVREQIDALEDAAAFSLGSDINLTTEQTTRQIMGAEVSTNYFDVLRAPMALGRGFAEQEGEREAEPVAVIGHAMWREELGGDPQVLGATVRLNGVDRTIIGVAAEGLLSPEQPVEYAAFIPIGHERAENRGWRGMAAFGRLREGDTVEEVRTQLGVLAARLQEEYPELWVDQQGRGDEFAVYPISALRVKPNLRNQIFMVLGLVVVLGLLVLATACSNLANLLLARGSKRGTEIAVRLAMGADRRALVVMLLSESVVLGCAGGGLGLLVTHWATQALAAGHVGPGFGIDLTVDWRVFTFTALVSVLTGMIFGLVPALQASSPDLTSALKGERTVFRGSRGISFRNFLVVTQVAASVILLVSAGFVLRGLQQSRSMDLGFEPDGVVAVQIDLSQGAYSEEQGRQFFADLLTRLSTVPQIEAADLTVSIPFGNSRWMAHVVPEGIEKTPETEVLADESMVTPGYFDLLGMPLVQGQTFGAAAVDGAREVAVINESLAERLWPDESAIGQRFYRGSETIEVVGVVREARYGPPQGEPSRHLWVPFAQSYHEEMFLMVKARGDAGVVIPTIRQVVGELDPELPVLEPRLMATVIEESSGDARIMSLLMAGAGAVALFLAVTGLYGVVSFIVSQRTHEVGVRVALGADRGQVVRMILLQGLRMTSVGIVVGLLAAFGVAHVLAAMIAAVDPLDPVAPLVGAAILLGAALLATLIPALRASRVDPMVALRHE
jgi:predicted permease